MKKYIRIEEGGYRGKDMSGRIFPIVKDFQSHASRPGGFVTVNTTQLAGFEGLDKVRINVPTLASISIVTQGEWIQHKDQLYRKFDHYLHLPAEDSKFQYNCHLHSSPHLHQYLDSYH